MKKKFDQVYQFKITLQEIKPPIWRRIQVPQTYTFYVSGNIKYNWKKFSQEKRTLNIRYASKEKEHVHLRMLAG